MRYGEYNVSSDGIHSDMVGVLFPVSFSSKASFTN